MRVSPRLCWWYRAREGRAVHPARYTQPRMPRCALLLWVLAATAPGAIAVTDPAPGSTAAPPAPAGLSPAGPPPAAPAVSHGCLPTGNGYLRARIRGALNLDINWRNANTRSQIAVAGRQATRSEEHTSELQSLAYLVCR